MRLVKCPNGHTYNADRFGLNCPQCGAAMQTASNTSEQTTVPLTGADDAPLYGTEPTQPNDPDNGDVTMAVASDMLDGIAAQAAPVVGWLVCTKGVNKGKDYRLHQGRNFIGRSPKMDVYIQGDITVSRSTHAVIVYDPRSNVYLAQPGEAKELLYLNDALVLNPTALKKLDKLSIGDTTLMFIPLCGEDFHW